MTVLMLALGILAGLNIVTFAIYWFDKSAARGGRRRVPENLLQVLALLGGWPGAFMAQRVLRHKTQKITFQCVFWLAVVVNCSAMWWGVRLWGIN